MRLSRHVVLTHRHEIDVLAHAHRADVGQIARERVVGGEREQERTVAAQMRLARHRHGRIRDRMRELGERVARARADDERFERTRGTERLRVTYRQNGRVTRHGFELPEQRVGAAEPRVGMGGGEADDGEHVASRVDEA